MKSLILILLSSAPILAMELSQESLKEFIANKKQMVAVSEGKVDAHNSLFKRYVELSRLDEAAAAQEYAKPELQAKAKSFYEWLSAFPEYNTALQIAKTVNTQEVWEKFRQGNGPLVQQYFDQNGIKTIKTSVADFFNVNPQLTD
ncbi:hypothetical protein BH09DEP1_BH09DEP1_4390 [soil metagenome]